MTIRDKINQISTKADLFPELSLKDKLINKIVVFRGNFVNWIKNHIFMKFSNIVQLNRLYNLTKKKNWNLYNADPIPKSIYKIAKNIIRHLNYQPMVINPTANESIQFEWENKYSYIEYEITQRSVKVFILITEDVNKIKYTSISGYYTHTNYDGLNKLIKKYFL